MISKKIIISGKVQSVGYRYWLQKICNQNEVFGWVKNLQDGNVEAFFYHITDEVFKDIISKCFLGPTSAEVTNIYIENSNEIFEKKDFLIKKN